MVNIDTLLRRIGPKNFIGFGDLVRKSGGRLYLVINFKGGIYLLNVDNGEVEDSDVEPYPYATFAELQQEVTLVMKAENLMLTMKGEN